jgi:hypothetical protein
LNAESNSHFKITIFSDTPSFHGKPSFWLLEVMLPYKMADEAEHYPTPFIKDEQARYIESIFQAPTI